LQPFHLYDIRANVAMAEQVANKKYQSV